MKTGTTKKTLKATAKVRVRFNEVDSLRIVWHGHYLKYFEEGREAFSDEYELNYLQIYEQYGLVMPIVSSSCKYKHSLKYGDVALVETEFVNSEAAKVKFKYRVFRESDNKLVALGETEQVFLTEEGELQLVMPDFLLEWKKKWGLL